MTRNMKARECLGTSLEHRTLTPQRRRGLALGRPVETGPGEGPNSEGASHTAGEKGRGMECVLM